ncbi:hypothetical protein E0H80_06355 [Acinetobacter sp. ANC 4779]|uniref:hypothetical protein n=1 Tax=Acinetobacter sp. ANC 4779 TaxID=2529848 RepID=UPI00103FAFCD|nr:hypothetical protein [Acinetobacter sp. ANC 4779]TCB50985.1 hypothetical protein E0H80_06355 [Acinetobacter sp. ANC 4779]
MSEIGLVSEDPDEFAKAVSHCKGYTPECISNGKCQSGECFQSKPVICVDNYAEGEIKRLNKIIEDLRVKQTLFESTIEHHICQLDQSYKSLKTALNEQRRWAIHFARQRFLDLQKDLKRDANDINLTH